MELSFPIIFYFILGLLLLLVNAVCAAAELAVLRSSPEPFEQEEVRKRWTSRAACWLLARVDISLAVSQLGRSLSSILLGWLAYVMFLEIDRSGALLSVEGLASQHRTMSASLALFVTVMVHLVVAGMVAKSLSMRLPERTLSVLAIPLLIVAQLFRPALFVVIGISNIILKFFNTSVPDSAERMHSASDISRIVTQSTEHGVFDEHEETMLRGVFGFSDTVAREVMTPRTDLVAVDVGATLPEVLAHVEETGFSRFPLSGNGIDDIHGILLVKDLLSYLAEKGEARAEEFHTSQVMREAYFIPGTKPIDELLNEFKSRKLHMAIVLDEHGGVDGLVTLEDLIEEIVGDIYDESDTAESDIVEEENGDIIVGGGMHITELNERLTVDVPEGEYDTIAGFIFTFLGRMPEPGDEVSITQSGLVVVAQSGDSVERNSLELLNGASNENGLENSEEEVEDPPKLLIRVEKVENHRIESVRLIRAEDFEEAETRTAISASQS